MGRERAARAAEALCDRGDLRLLLAAGFAAALAPDLRPGDLVCATVMLQVPDPGLGIVTGRLACHRDYSELASHRARVSGSGIPHVAPLVTTDRLLVTSGAKRDLASSLASHWDGPPPLAVDMESAGVAEVAARRGVPFAAIRAISDGFDEDLPLDFARCAGRDGQIRLAAVMAELLRQPYALPRLVRLGRNSRIAAERLAAFLADVL
jgi:nucleoside phosphorylase